MSNPMGLTIPIPGVTTGPDYAQQVSDSLTTIASHGHTGDPDGNQITSAGLNIDGDVSFHTANSITDAKSAKFASQSATLGGVGDVSTVYVVNGDLYYNNSSGTPVKVTSGSSVNTAGTNLTWAYLAVSSNHTITGADLDTFFGIDTSAARTITLPSASSVAAGRRYWLADMTANAATHNVTISKSGLDTIDGQTSHKIQANHGGCVIVSNGSNGWKVLDSFNATDGITIDGPVVFKGGATVTGGAAVTGGLTTDNLTTSLISATVDIEIDASGNPVFQTSGGAGTVSVGDTASTSTLALNAIDEVTINLNGSTLLDIDGDAQLIVPAVPVQFPPTATATISQADKTTVSGTGATFTIQAQNETGATSTGGALVLQSGSGTTTQGLITLKAGTHPLVSFSQASAGNVGVILDASQNFFIFQANGSGQGIVYQAITGSIFFDAPTLFLRDATSANTLTATLSSAGTTSITAASTVTSFLVNQADKTTNGGTGASLTVQAQNETGTTSTGGNLVLKSGTGTSTRGNASLIGATIFIEATQVQFTDLTGPSTALTFALNATGTTSLSFANTVTAASISQADKTTNGGTAANLTIQAQNETGTTSTGGDLALKSGTGTSQDGFITLKQGSATTAKFGIQNLAGQGNKTYLDFGATSGGMAASSQLISCAYGVGGNVYFFANAGTCHFGQASNLDALTVDSGIHFNVSGVKFQTAVTSPTFAQDDLATNSGTGATLTVQAQNETGTTSTGGALVLQSGTGTSAPGLVTVKAGSTTVMNWSSTGIVAFDAALTSVILNQSSQAGTGVTASAGFTIQAQSGRAVASGTNNSGGNLNLKPGAVGSGGSGGAGGTLTLSTGGGTTRITINDTGLGFFGVSGVAQPSRVGQLTDSTAGTPGTTLAALTGTYATDVATLRNWGASLIQRINALELVLHNNGLTG